MGGINGKVKAKHQYTPKIYAYTHPGVVYHEGYTKIGETREQTADERVAQQHRTSDIVYKLEWSGNATFEDEYATPFHDHELHAYLTRLGYERKKAEGDDHLTEFFRIDPAEAKTRFYEFRENGGIVEVGEPTPYVLRDEQEAAVEAAQGYFEGNDGAEFLWNAKPRFGKTLATYDLIKRTHPRHVLIVTNRPSIANSWYDDYEKFLGTDSQHLFVSNVDGLKDKPMCHTYKDYARINQAQGRVWTDKLDDRLPQIRFVSLQDLKGSLYFGGDINKLKDVKQTDWDLLVIDEAHEGVDTYKADVAFDQISPKAVLHLSGTPFKALASAKFPTEAIYNWTYADEQAAKQNWDRDESNPYATLPQLNLLTYKMGEAITGEAQEGAEIDGERVPYAFDLNEFFSTKSDGTFTHLDDVEAFLDNLTSNEKYPFSTPELQNELKHTLWMFDRVASAKAMKKVLKRHPVFKDYEVVVAAGDGAVDDEDRDNAEALARVRKAIVENDKTITLSVGQLTTGVTVPEWTGVLMLSNMNSPSLYMQTAFRAQNPHVLQEDGRYYQKENAYVFDFDPVRTLDIYERIANDLAGETAGGRGTVETRKKHIGELLNFLPVLSEDDEGEMVPLDAGEVLSVPRKIRAHEVVRHGFMSNLLFTGIGRLFSASPAAMKVFDKMKPYQGEPFTAGIDEDTADDLNLDSEGNVDMPEHEVIGLADDVFGSKRYNDATEKAEETVQEVLARPTATATEIADALTKVIDDAALGDIVTAAADALDPRTTKKARERLQRKVKEGARQTYQKAAEKHTIRKKEIAAEREDALENAITSEEIQAAEEAFQQAQKEESARFVEEVAEKSGEIVAEAQKTAVKEVETAKKTVERDEKAEKRRKQLQGFAATIPSFLLGYGTKDTCLANFEEGISDEVFSDLTGITVDEFRLVRDEGVFDEVVFDDAVQEFMDLRKSLADYFDPEQKESIFDYVPRQSGKRPQIFTPKWLVRDMVDKFEQANPGCFEDPTTTYADLYVKSGLYITEIVTRLFNSEGMKAAFPDEDERLRHIFEYQVYMAAPTELLYRITRNFILGPNEELAHGADVNMVCEDTDQLCRAGKLDQWVEKTFGGKMAEASRS